MIFNYDETKSKEEKNKENWSKNAQSGQSVRYRTCWKPGNINMAVIEDHTSYLVHKDLPVTTKRNV